jgi:hypothetical protein
VGGLGGNAIAEVVPAEVLREAEPDRLRDCAPALVAQWNLERVRFWSAPLIGHSYLFMFSPFH